MKPKHFILTFLTLLVSITVSAYTFTVDGIYYKILSETDKTVAVVNNMRYNSYSSSCYEGDVIIPNTVTYAGISYDVTEIGGWAFYQCKLTDITIPNSITSIGKYAFGGCYNLTSIEIPSSVSEINDYTFSGCSGLTRVNIPNSITTIGKGAFNGCIKLTSVSIPNSVTEIGEYAFAGCI
ncbi:MAG: leucine-rich repeat domain-containing protein [Bacteroidaceae bacterium]|nr:leucine-rich repeat domain-containing protein [Bacteroidaceae bacterium]